MPWLLSISQKRKEMLILGYLKTKTKTTLNYLCIKKKNTSMQKVKLFGAL